MEYGELDSESPCLVPMSGERGCPEASDADGEEGYHSRDEGRWRNVGFK